MSLESQFPIGREVLHAETSGTLTVIGYWRGYVTVQGMNGASFKARPDDLAIVLTDDDIDLADGGIVAALLLEESLVDGPADFRCGGIRPTMLEPFDESGS